MITVINDWAKILDKKGQVDTFILDFEKAFDTPPHELLKSKLFSYGIGGKTLEWIKKVQVGKDQEKAQSEKDSHSKNRGGKKPN